MKYLTLAKSETSRTIVCDSDDETWEEMIGRNSLGAYIRTTVKSQVTLLLPCLRAFNRTYVYIVIARISDHECLDANKNHMSVDGMHLDSGEMANTAALFFSS